MDNNIYWLFNNANSDILIGENLINEYEVQQDAENYEPHWSLMGYNFTLFLLDA